MDVIAQESEENPTSEATPGFSVCNIHLWLHRQTKGVLPMLASGNMFGHNELHINPDDVYLHMASFRLPLSATDGAPISGR